MRSFRVVLAFMLGLAMAGPETHACPVHDAGPPGAHDHDGGHHQKAGQCTCPQVCCPATAPAPLPATTSSWTAAPAPILISGATPAPAGFLPSREHLLPFALAPPPPPPVALA